VVVVEGFSVVIHLGGCDWALRVARRDELRAPLDDKARTSQFRSQTPEASDLSALRVRSIPGRLVVITRHAGNRLNPRDEIAQFGVPGREFAESADAKARNFMRAGVGSTGSVP
jgi:hypothetical protein